MSWRGDGDTTSVAGVFYRLAPLAPVGAGNEALLDLASEGPGKGLVIRLGQLRAVLAKETLECFGFIPRARRDLDPGAGGFVRLPVDGRQVFRRPQIDQRRFDLNLRLVADPEALDLPDGHLATVPPTGDFPDVVFKLDEARFRGGKPRLVPQQGPGSGVRQTASSLPVPPFVQLPPQERAVRRQGSIRDHQPVRGEHHLGGRSFQKECESGSASRRTPGR